VTASAVVAILGSAVVLLVALMSIASLFIVMPQARPPDTTPFIVAGAVIFIALGGAGIWTSVGLFRLRPWARTSMQVFAGFMAGCCIFGLIVTLAMPMPPEIAAGTESTFRRSMAVIYGVPFAIAVWWLIQFSTQSTKAAFSSSISGVESSRPLSIAILGWVSILGGVSCVLPILTRMPAFLFGAIFTGWTAGVVYAVFGAVSFYIGKGLLDLRERARVVAIVWIAFSFVHLAFVTLVPSLRQRMLEFQRVLPGQYQKEPIPFDQGLVMNATFVLAAIVTAAIIWFLTRNRAVFLRV
jgi:hypothetical protein